jgi:hypothetical protein
MFAGSQVEGFDVLILCPSLSLWRKLSHYPSVISSPLLEQRATPHDMTEHTTLTSSIQAANTPVIGH